MTFLAGVSGQLLMAPEVGSSWATAQFVIQLLALLLLSSAGATIIRELWPSDYTSLPTPKEDSDWIEKLSTQDPNEHDVLETVLRHKLSSAIARVEHNKSINDKKSRLLAQTFRLIAAAMVLVLGNLILLAARAAWPIFGFWFRKI